MLTVLQGAFKNFPLNSLIIINHLGIIPDPFAFRYSQNYASKISLSLNMHIISMHGV